jgi:hypothetical protein
MRRSRSSAAAAVVVGAAAVVVGAAACGPVSAPPPGMRCPGERPVAIASPADVARFAGCTALPGVTVRTGAALDLSRLRALTAVTGDLVIGPTVGVELVSLGALRRVDGELRVVGNGLLQGVYLPRLERAGRIAIDGNPALTTISLPRLTAIGGALRVNDDASLELIEVSALETVGQEIAIAGAPRLALVEAGQLRRAAEVQLDAPSLPAEVAEQLRAVAAR